MKTDKEYITDTISNSLEKRHSIEAIFYLGIIFVVSFTVFILSSFQLPTALPANMPRLAALTVSLGLSVVIQLILVYTLYSQLQIRDSQIKSVFNHYLNCLLRKENETNYNVILQHMCREHTTSPKVPWYVRVIGAIFSINTFFTAMLLSFYVATLIKN